MDGSRCSEWRDLHGRFCFLPVAEVERTRNTDPVRTRTAPHSAARPQRQDMPAQFAIDDRSPSDEELEDGFRNSPEGTPGPDGNLKRKRVTQGGLDQQKLLVCFGD